MPAKEKPGQQKHAGKHADPNAAASSSTNAADKTNQINGITPIQIPDKFISDCYYHAPATTSSSSLNTFDSWGGQVPQTFPSAADSSFFGGGGASRSFDVLAVAEDDENTDAQQIVLSSLNRLKLELPDHRSEREKRLTLPAAIISRDTSTDDVAIRRFDTVSLDNVPLDEFYALLTETSFVKRESMLRKDQQRGRGGDVQLFLDGEAVDYAVQYKSMLERIFLSIDHMGGKNKNLDLPAVRVEPQGRTTIWINFKDIYAALKREKEEVRSFICNELTTTSKYDGEGRLHIDVIRLTQAKLQKLVTDYTMSHVYCESCHTFDTKLVRDAALRLDLVVCNKCNASRSVASTSGGFQAIVNRRGRLRARALA